jgi:hypothetical protein
MMTARRLAVLLGLSACTYALAVRPRLLHWGGTEEEVRRPYPGSDVVSGGERGATMAVTIDAPPSQVWPWLVQMGCDRAGWYSWDRLDNGGVPSAEQIRPEWQELSVGDRLTSTPSRSAWFEVAALEPGRFLALRAPLDLRGRPFETGGPTAALLQRLALGFPAGGAAKGAHPPRDQGLRLRPAAAPPGDRELPLLGARALDHAEAPAREPETTRRTRFERRP